MAQFRLEMRDHTRRAVSDVAAEIMCHYGIVLTPDEVQDVAQVIDRELMRFGDCVKSMTPDQWQEAKRDVVKRVEL